MSWAANETKGWKSGRLVRVGQAPDHRFQIKPRNDTKQGLYVGRVGRL
jgi:hypothetical protein